MASAAAAGPTLLAYNLSPSPTFLNQALALALWGWFVVFVLPPPRVPSRGAGPLLAAIGLLLLAVLGSWGPGSLPTGLALSALGCLLAAAVLAASGAAVQGRPDAAVVFGDFCIGWAVAGAFSAAVACIQVFWPGLADGDWIAVSGLPGRAVGNLRQPNHLSSVLLWAAVATVALVDLRRLRWGLALVLVAALVFADVLSASRTGTVGVILLGLWGAFDRRLSRRARALLLAAPLLYVASWLAMDEWSHLTTHIFGGTERLEQGDISSSRFAIWSNTLALIRQQPWLGVGFGEFNLAWTLTPFPHRPGAFFDNAHMLPLQLAVEIGVPLALAVLALLGWGLWQGARRAFGPGAEAGDLGVARRAAMMMVALIAIHSLLEYPLWYLYFLLPTAWAWAFALGGGPAAGGASSPRPPSVLDRLRAPALAVGGAALAVSAVLSVYDYSTVAAIFSADEGAPPLEARIERGQHSLLFAHHGDYAAATNEPATGGLRPFRRAVHYLLDARLMRAWAITLAAAHHEDEARWVAQRLREFHNPGAEDFFAPCKGPAPRKPLPFQCQAPERAHDWREFVAN
ncbi:MAG: O-antigen ligase C-terminal domain-containing protein [Burkholderiales bacterium]|nr:O-antigen ligase C-terminal domain-containing protein [Burkholderiales bacterium]